jgi:hypothetical protein
MPGILPKYDPNDKHTIELGNAERKERIKLIDAYWTYYKDGGARKPLKVRPGQPDDNVMLNYSQQAIDKSVSFFAPKPPTFLLPDGMEREPGPDGKLQNVLSPEQEAVNTFLEQNEFDHQIVDIALSGFISGHNFMRLYPPDNTEKISGDNPPRMALIDPRKAIAFWDVSNIRRLLFYRVMWTVAEDTFRVQDIVPTWLVNQSSNPEQKPDINLGWEIIEYECKGETGERKEVGRDHWEHPFAPMVDWKNKHAPHEYYGESDLRAADLNDAINFIASNTARIIKFHAHPKTIGKGLDPGAIKATSVDGFYAIPENSDVFNVEMQSDLSSSLNYLNKLESAFFTQMHVLDVSTIKDKVGGLTNFGLRMLFKDMTDAADTKHSLYGSGLAETVRRAMIMMGIEAAKKPKDTWIDPLPANVTELTAALKIQDEMQIISKQTIQEQLQLDPIKESERQDEEKQNGTDASVDILSKMGDRGLFNNGLGGQIQPPRLPLAS